MFFGQMISVDILYHSQMRHLRAGAVFSDLGSLPARSVTDNRELALDGVRAAACPPPLALPLRGQLGVAVI